MRSIWSKLTGMSPVVRVVTAAAAALTIGGIIVLLSNAGTDQATGAASGSAKLPEDLVEDVGPRRERTERPEGAMRGSQGAPERLGFVPGRVLARFHPGSTGSEREAVAAALDGELIDRGSVAGSYLIRFPAEISPEAAAETLAASPAVLYAEPDFIYHATAVPSDARFGRQWGQHNTGQNIAGATGAADADMDAPEAWDLTTGSRTVTVGVVDTGVAYDHPDLAANMWVNPGESGSGKENNGIDDDGNGYVDDRSGWDWVGGDRDPRDLHGHGTHVAGTIGARGNDGVGVAGVNWNVSLVPLRSLNASGSGTTSDLARAFTYAGKAGIDVVNASLGGSSFSQTLLDSIARSPDTLFVVAAGNEGADNETTASYPCNYSVANLVCVAATDSSDRLAGFSNYGITSVDLGAPGQGIISTIPAFSFPFEEDFEGDLATRWVPGGTGGSWGRSSDEYGYFASDSPGIPYAGNVDSWITTVAPFDLRSVAGCTLRYGLKLDTQPKQDRFLVEASSDGTDFRKISERSGSSSGGWLDISDDLSAFDGAAQVWLRLRFVSDADVQRDGVELDDLELSCAATSYDGNQYSFSSGTSMATPQVAGAAALLWATAPGSTALQIKDALMLGGDSLPSLAGKTMSGKRLNLVGSLSLLGAMSPAPQPTATGISQPADQAPPAAPPPASETPSSTPSTSPSSPAPSPTQSSPSPQPSAGQGDAPSQGAPPSSAIAVSRTVELRLKRHLVALGSVATAGDYAACSSGVIVEIRRNGARIARVRTDGSGRFRARLPERPGRYKAVALATPFDRGECLEATSNGSRHRH